MLRTYIFESVEEIDNDNNGADTIRGPAKYAYKGATSGLPAPIQKTNIVIDKNRNFNKHDTGSFLRLPTANNPMMNVPIYAYDLPEAYGNYDRYAKYRDTRGNIVGQQVEKDLSGSLFKNPEDFLFKKDASERQFYSVPIGSNSPNTVEFAESLYGTKNNCKNATIFSRQGLLYTDDSLMCTPGHQVPPLSGFGNLGQN